MITEKDVDHVALLGRLKLTDEERSLYTGQLNNILEHFERLKELATDDVPPTAHVLPLKNVFRADRTGPDLDQEEVLAGAPDRDGSYFKVPRIV
ncbi:MAG TPA: Asp-tRNA(Asn)/Glu-tRNA(Gln) amidotransferase subunit GatC [Spirochaetia bacterium]|nr:Asp-tRNA(Asn)/Glu-tRNA(Gln) amidotransferase subunit GatC [Spirochaetia bacterium]